MSQPIRCTDAWANRLMTCKEDIQVSECPEASDGDSVQTDPLLESQLQDRWGPDHAQQ